MNGLNVIKYLSLLFHLSRKGKKEERPPKWRGGEQKIKIKEERKNEQGGSRN